jgi:hypothetical protein
VDGALVHGREVRLHAGVILGDDEARLSDAKANLKRWLSLKSFFSNLKLPPHTLAGFDLTTHGSPLLSGRRRRYR